MGNDPVNAIDPLGLDPSFWSLGGGLSAGAGTAVLVVVGASNPVGWVLLGVGAVVIIADNINDIDSAATTVDRAKANLKPVDDYHKKQEDDLKKLDECQ